MLGLTRVHHIGICVRQLDLALEIYAARLGLISTPPILHNDEVRAALITIGDDRLEIFEPRQPAGALGRFLERRGEGLHHVAYQVDDIDAALAALTGRGTRLIDAVARPGLHAGWRIAFVHPNSAAGVLTELVEVVAAVEAATGQSE